MTAAIKLTGVRKSFPISRGAFRSPTHLHALHPISLEIQKGETLGVVGESGCGKSTLARMLVGLISPSAGMIEIDGQDLSVKNPGSFGQKIQYVFQDPISSLNPRKTIRQIIEAPLKYLHKLPPAERSVRIRNIFDSVKLREDFLTRYPHEFSGGQAQRIGLARALAADAKIIVLDEPVSALDVSVQAQVLNLLADLKEQLDLTYVFISHDLAVVEAVSDRVAVLYFGSLVELGPAEQVFSKPCHPYTKLLANSAPRVGVAIGRPEASDTELPDPLNPPLGCAFVKRCPMAKEKCTKLVPDLRLLENGVQVACHFAKAT
jgi:peptide/nickel transport system ATP-binding protein